MVLVGGWLVAAALQPPGYDPVRQTISVLAGQGARDRWLLTACLAAVGCCHLVTAAGLRGAPARARVLLAVCGIAGLGVAAFAQPVHGSDGRHVACAAVAIVGLGLWPFAAARAGRGGIPGPRAGAVVGLLNLALLGWLGSQLAGGSLLGLAERAATTVQVLWPPILALALRAPDPGSAAMLRLPRSGRLEP